jgi:superfamily II DNA or RNA helicase
MSLYKNRRDKYIDLKINGRIFPQWILANFKSYKLPDIMQSEDDPCFTKTKDELRKYQVFLSKYLDVNGPYKNILIYHGVGSGKTASTINIYNMLYNASSGINVFILIKAALIASPWIIELNKWLLEDRKTDRMQNINFISYDAPNADKTFMEKIKGSDLSKRNLFIIEEAHGFISNVYSNITSKKGKRAQVIYDYMIQDQRENDNTRIIMLSGTPAINNPYELALTFNLLRPNIFSKNESVFNQEFISSTSYPMLNPSRKNLFQRRIMGLVSYYIGSTPDYFASKKIEYIDIEMSKYQEDIYSYYEEMEEKMDKKKHSKSSESSYKSYTRQSGNFVFPLMAQGMSGETRPRPKGFKISDKIADALVTGQQVIDDKDNDNYHNIKTYVDAVDKFIKVFDTYLDEKNTHDVSNKHTIFDDVKIFMEKYNTDYDKFHKSEKHKSSLYDEMYKCSAKMLHIIFKILISPGPVLVYSNYVLMEGLQIFKIYLKQFGYSKLDDSGTGEDYFRYTEFHGQISKEDRKKNILNFNDDENIHGKVCKIMMISPAGTEGIGLMNVRQVHLMEPYWHEVRMVQMIGRAVRICSHKKLTKAERHVDIYRYKSVRAGTGKWTTDQKIENIARSKDGLIQSFLDAIKEVAIDCVLNKTHNSLVGDYKCFQFQEDKLFDDQIGPAYKEDIYDDKKLDNGSNSAFSQTIRIKVIKIMAVKTISIEPLKYSESEKYWYNPITGVVYDYESQYPIGKIGYDEGLPKKLDKDTYIIDKVIPIPLIS